MSLKSGRGGLGRVDSVLLPSIDILHIKDVCLVQIVNEIDPSEKPRFAFWRPPHGRGVLVKAWRGAWQ